MNKAMWKEHFLKSGVPLEYEAASVLADEEMVVSADFSFLRRDVSGFKEWSIDIVADWYGPDEDHPKFNLELLVECKFRSPEKFLLLLQDPDKTSVNGTLGGTVFHFDSHCSFELPPNGFVPLEDPLPWAYKGIELYDKGAIEGEFRHGIQQLRYASPAALRKQLDFLISGHPTDRLAILQAKILLTNAPIRILRRGTSISDIKSARDIDDISELVETAILYSDYGPDFEAHVRSIFSEDADSRLTEAKLVRDDLVSKGRIFDFLTDPVEITNNLANAERYECTAFGTQFFVTTSAGLQKLTRDLKRTCIEAYADRIEAKTEAARDKPMAKLKRD